MLTQKNNLSLISKSFYYGAFISLFFIFYYSFQLFEKMIEVPVIEYITHYLTYFMSFYVTKDYKYLNNMMDTSHIKNIKRSTLQSKNNKKIIGDDINYKNLKIGGLNKELKEILDRAFILRDPKYSEICKDIKFKHIKGILLYGPPGTGKTLIARKLSKELLNASSIKIVNGPELIDKYIGESERKMRELFEDAENDRSSTNLHVIIFDEIDSVCRKRSGADNTDSRMQSNMVNTLLSKMDGIDQLNNILIIGMTNRLEMIDPALLRPGRFELQIPIKLPDSTGRKEIFDIYLDENIRKHFEVKCDVSDLAEITYGYSGADIEGLIRKVITEKITEGSNKVLELNDFERNLK